MKPIYWERKIRLATSRHERLKRPKVTLNASKNEGFPNRLRNFIKDESTIWSNGSSGIVAVNIEKKEFSITDNCTATLTNVVQTPAAMLPVVSYPVSIVVTDDVLNEATCTLTLSIEKILETEEFKQE